MSADTRANPSKGVSRWRSAACTKRNLMCLPSENLPDHTTIAAPPDGAALDAGGAAAGVECPVHFTAFSRRPSTELRPADDAPAHAAKTGARITRKGGRA